jgi:hypothetical protein
LLALWKQLNAEPSMNDYQKGLLIAALAMGMILCVSRAHAAQDPNPGPWPGSAAGSSAPAALHRVQRASRYLEQAALQWDFASNARQLDLLRQARGDLQTALPGLRGLRRRQAAALSADIGRVLVRDTSPLEIQADAGLDTGGPNLGPLAPSRDELAVLAKEGQDLVRSAPVAIRPSEIPELALDGGPGFASSASGIGTNASPDGADASANDGVDPLFLPDQASATSTQLHFRF